MTPADSPWLTLAEMAGYIRRGKPHTRKAVKDGRLRAARVGGKNEIIGRREWCDEYLESLAAPVVVPVRKRSA